MPPVSRGGGSALFLVLLASAAFCALMCCEARSGPHGGDGAYRWGNGTAPPRMPRNGTHDHPGNTTHPCNGTTAGPCNATRHGGEGKGEHHGRPLLGGNSWAGYGREQHGEPSDKAPAGQRPSSDHVALLVNGTRPDSPRPPNDTRHGNETFPTGACNGTFPRNSTRPIDDNNRHGQGGRGPHGGDDGPVNGPHGDGDRPHPPCNGTLPCNETRPDRPPCNGSYPGNETRHDHPWPSNGTYPRNETRPEHPWPCNVTLPCNGTRPDGPGGHCSHGRSLLGGASGGRGGGNSFEGKGTGPACGNWTAPCNGTRPERLPFNGTSPCNETRRGGHGGAHGRHLLGGGDGGSRSGFTNSPHDDGNRALSCNGTRPERPCNGSVPCNGTRPDHPSCNGTLSCNKTHPCHAWPCNGTTPWNGTRPAGGGGGASGRGRHDNRHLLHGGSQRGGSYPEGTRPPRPSAGTAGSPHPSRDGGHNVATPYDETRPAGSPRGPRSGRKMLL